MKIRLTLKNSLTLKFILVAILPIIVTGFITLRIYSQHLTAEIHVKHLALAKSLAGEVQMFLNEPLSLLGQIEEVIDKRKLISEEQINEYLEALIRQYAFFDMIQILDEKGAVKYLAPFHEDYEGISLSGQPFFKAAEESRAIFWSPTFIAMQSGKPTLTLSRYFGKRIAVGYLNLDILNDITDKVKIGRHGYAIIADQEGTVIAHRNRRFVSERLNLKNLDVIRQGLKGREGTFLYRFENTGKLGSVAAVSSVGWMVSVIQPVEEAFEPIARIKIIFWGGTGLSLIMALGMALASLKKSLRPLSQLIDNARKIAGGDYDFRRQSRSYPEIDALAEHFKIMADAVKSREEALRKSEESLRRQNEYMAALHETSVGLASRLDIDELLNAIVSKAASLTRIPGAFLHLYNPETNILELKVGAGTFVQHVGFQIGPGKGLAGRVWETGKPLLVENYAAWSERSPNPGFDDCRSMVALPLTSGNHVQGVMGLAHTDEDKQIGAEELAILEQFARMASVALDNAQLYTRIQEELAERKRMELERERMEAQLRQAQKMEALGTLAGGIAHDFNNILFPIMGYTEMTITSLPNDELVQRNLKNVLSAAARAKDLVQQILAFSRHKSREHRSVKIQFILKEALKLLRATLPSTIEIRQNIDKDCGAVLADPTQIYQVMMNLCTNAYHAMLENGGILEVTLAQMNLGPNETVYYSDIVPGAYLKLTVSDTGCGMEKTVTERIFEPYFTTKPMGEGTGLGLSVVHGIIKSYHGHISVYSESGKGTTFHIYLPLASEDSGGSEVPEDIPLRGGNESILLVDDEEQIVGMEKQMLEQLGYRVTPMIRSTEALDLFRKESEKFDLVITDMTMPKMTGLELSRQMIRIRPDIPIILCTGFSRIVTEESAKASGIQEYVMKPVLEREMARIIRKVLDR